MSPGNPLEMGIGAERARGELSLFASKSALLSHYKLRLRVDERGTVLSTGDGIAWLSGLPSVAMDEILRFGDGSAGLVFYLGNNAIGSILLDQTANLTAGTRAFRTEKQMSIPTGDALLGRIINPLGAPLDGQPEPNCSSRRKLDTMSPPIIVRSFVDKPIYTGTKIIDCLIPIGKGQRQLVIGDTGLGKSSLCLNTILNQAGKDVLCVYVMIGQKRSSIVQTIETLRQSGALAYTVMVVAEANSLPGLQYLAPFAGCAIAEHWMWQGKDTLIVYDDLTTHARTYRELSLLLGRSPGREAYPGDVFFLHSRLLERSTRLSTAFGGGSMTALPIVETEQGEIASYIPTNLISITDGQLYLDRQLYVSGFRPAIDITRSVSRIGGKAQDELVKMEVGRLRLDYLQFLELEIFTRFGSKLEASVQRRIDRGRLVRQLLKQERLQHLPIEQQLCIWIATNDGLLDNLTKDQLPEAMKQLSEAVDRERPKLFENRTRWSDLARTTLRGRYTDSEAFAKEEPGR